MCRVLIGGVVGDGFRFYWGCRDAVLRLGGMVGCLWWLRFSLSVLLAHSIAIWHKRQAWAGLRSVPACGLRWGVIISDGRDALWL